jgi:hypothetical protein
MNMAIVLSAIVFVSFFVGGLFGLWLGTVFGSDYHYNMTDDLEKESRLLQACITFNLDLPACDFIYGSIPK